MRWRARAAIAIGDSALDAVLLFKQESMYWLTGYDTFGFAAFQCMVATGDGRVVLLTRAPDRWTAEYTSNVDDVRMWTDVEGMNPAADLRALLVDLGLEGGRVGIELDSHGLKAANWRLLEAQLDGCVMWRDGSELIQEPRRTKSAQEIKYHRRAAELADDAWDAAMVCAGAGAFEGDILAEMQGAVFRGGGAGMHRGGDGVVRRVRFDEPMEVNLLSSHRRVAPYGMAGGEPGVIGSNRVLRVDGSVEELGGVDQTTVAHGDRIELHTPGGGGWGAAG